MRLKILCIALIFITMLTACNNEDGSKDDSNVETDIVDNEDASENEKNPESENDKSNNDEVKDNVSNFNLEDIDPIPDNIDALTAQAPGPFAYSTKIYSIEDEIDQEMKEIGPLSDNPSGEEYEKYTRYLYWLIAEDFPDPQDVVKKWEFASFGSPDIPDSRFHFKENYNIEVILDSSGSMANPAGNGTRMDVAKESIKEFLSAVPEEANVSLRVYGHKGTGADSDKEMSCNSIEQVYGFKTYNEDNFQEALNQFKPMGWTPLADALKQSQEALSKFDSNKTTNLIYVVSDGIETCDGDPVAVAKELSTSTAQPIINIIGFQTDAEAQKQLKKMAEVSGGIFASASNEEELQEEFNRAEEVLEAWNEWKDDAMQDLDFESVKANTDIMVTLSDWHQASLYMDAKFSKLLFVIKDLGYINLEQKKELDKRKGKVFDQINKKIKELEADMKAISEQSIEDAKKTVEEKYKSQTSDE